MALLEKHLTIKRSRIPGAGKGLFTKTAIARGTRIVEYKGHRITWKAAQQQPHFNGYVYYLKRSLVIDAKNYVSTFARYANDATGITRVEGLKNNCRYEEDGEKVFIVARKAIPAGSEILVPYGREYWNVVRYNLKHGFL